MATALALVLAISCDAPQVQETPTTSLVHRQVIQQEIENGEKALFSVQLDAGDLLRIRVDQRSVDIALGLFSSDNEQLAYSDGENFIEGPEWLLASATARGHYVLELVAIAGSGNFELTVEALGAPASADSTLLEALKALGEIDEFSSHPGDLQRLDSILERGKRILPGIVLARLHYKKGKIRRELGHLDQAIDDLQAAFALFETFGNAWEQAPVLNHLAYVLILLGRLDEADTQLNHSLAISSQVDFPRALAATWSNRGVLYAARGDHSAALDSHGIAEGLYRQVGDRYGQAITQHNLGTQLLHLGQIDEGLESLQRAIEDWRGLANVKGEGRALASSGWGLELRAELSSERAKGYQEAIDVYSQAIDLFRQQGAQWDLAQALERRGDLFRRLGEFSRAQSDLELALTTSDQAADRMHRAWVHLGMGAVFRDIERLDDALRELTAATDLFDTQGHFSGRIAAQLELARLYRAIDESDQASVTLERAIEDVEQARQGLLTPEFRRTFLVTREALYTELVDLWAEISWRQTATKSATDRALAMASAARAFQAAERYRARTLLDQIAGLPSQGSFPSSILDSRFQRVLSNLEARQVSPGAIPTDPRALRRARIEWSRARESDRGDHQTPQVDPTQFGDILSLLGKDTTLLAYHLGQDRSWLFLANDESLQVFPLAPRNQIEHVARRCHQLLNRASLPGFRQAYRTALAEIAALVLAPVTDQLPSGRLVVIPAGALHLIPFGLLSTPGAQTLVSTHEISHLPSASVLLHLRKRIQSRNRAPSLIALVADPVFSSDDPRMESLNSVALPGSINRAERPHLARLEGTLKETQRIAAMAQDLLDVPPPPIHSAFDANLDLLTGEKLAGYRILHFATHGLVDTDDPALSGLLFSFYNPEGRLRNGFLPTRRIYNLRIDADLVVLSACRTGLGQSIRGEGLVGLSHGFFSTGARHLVVSLWEVDDRATAELMTNFYHHLFTLRGAPARALQLAQLEMRDDPRWTSPDQWGGFISVGDWEVSISD